MAKLISRLLLLNPTLYLSWKYPITIYKHDLKPYNIMRLEMKIGKLFFYIPNSSYLHWLFHVYKIVFNLKFISQMLLSQFPLSRLQIDGSVSGQGPECPETDTSTQLSVSAPHQYQGQLSGQNMQEPKRVV